MKKAIGVVILLLMLMLILGCINKTTTEDYKIDQVDTVDILDIDYINEFGILTYTFNISDKKIMFDRNIQFLGIAIGEPVVLITVDNDPYQMTHNVEKRIKNRTINVTDIDNKTKSVKITVKII